MIINAPAGSRLPDYVDAAQARATVQRGMLTVHLPKRKDAAARSIPVHAVS